MQVFTAIKLEVLAIRGLSVRMLSSKPENDQEAQDKQQGDQPTPLWQAELSYGPANPTVVTQPITNLVRGVGNMAGRLAAEFELKHIDDFVQVRLKTGDGSQVVGFCDLDTASRKESSGKEWLALATVQKDGAQEEVRKEKIEDVGEVQLCWKYIMLSKKVEKNLHKQQLAKMFQNL
eukprot:TRINITY_DN29536_c0_g2_i1.p1 TRINITY_DN29536_c0_g2~~TRINITY_DN29536_c0_g2_i1.p1  ORF type:complete len:208 (+),score=42.28 TRINITY_DN29536_c0_g2_i1:94-624(+)